MNTYRIRIIEALQLIAPKSLQIDLYDEHGNEIDISERLLKDWEAVYRPEEAGFAVAFSESELKQLNCFTDFLLSRQAQFPLEFNQLLKDPYWNSVCEFAGELLADLSKNEAVV